MFCKPAVNMRKKFGLGSRLEDQTVYQWHESGRGQLSSFLFFCSGRQYECVFRLQA